MLFFHLLFRRWSATLCVQHVHIRRAAMATKTIAIDLGPYRRLSQARRDDESVSRVIKRVVRPSLDVHAYLPA